jgi:hypothetical protein
MIPNPRTDRPQQPSAFSVLSFKRGDVQPSHARATHQLGHAVDDDHGIVIRLIERRNEASSVLAVHDVDHKNNVRVFEICFDFEPLAIAQRRAKVVRRDTQVEFVSAIELTLRVSKRR